MSTLEETTIHTPDVVIWVHVETYLNDFSSLAQVKIQFRTFKKVKQNSYKSKFNFELFCKKKKKKNYVSMLQYS